MFLKLIVNILWFIFGGFELAIGWAVTGLILCCTIVGIPLGTQCFKMARLVMLPLGTKVTYNMGVVKGCFNVLWACTFGLVFALCSALVGLLWCCTVVGIPGRVVRQKNMKVPRTNMDHCHLPDPVRDDLKTLQKEYTEVTNRLLEVEKELRFMRNIKGE